jgi:hypothetical protein
MSAGLPKSPQESAFARGKAYRRSKLQRRELNDGRLSIAKGVDKAGPTVVIHRWHAEADQSRLSENERKLAEVTAIDLVRNAATCDLGGKMFRPR